MKSLIIEMEKLPLWLKVVLALPMLDIIWVIYRIIRSLDKKSYFGVILGIVMVIIGIPFLWLVDIICILCLGHVYWID